ncbi:MAG: LysE family translocator [Arenicella sp.]|nr:LysE family translocator [Arenicella sp.]
MNEYSFLLAIAGVLFIGAMSPGPSFFIVAQNSLSKSRAHGVATALGTGLGVSLFAILASFGVTALLENIPSAYLVFKLLGGAYLLYLAYKIWLAASEPLEIASEGDRLSSKHQGTLFKAFLTGLITQTSNPKTALVIAGIFAAFVPAEPPTNTAVLVAVIAFVIDFCWYAIVAVSLSTMATRNIYKKAKTNFDRTASIFLGVVGIKLLVA